MENQFGIYDDFLEIKTVLEADVYLLETIILNGKNEDVNKYLERAIPEMRKALSYMSDAEFELFTSPRELLNCLRVKKHRKLRLNIFLQIDFMVDNSLLTFWVVYTQKVHSCHFDCLRYNYNTDRSKIQ